MLNKLMGNWVKIGRLHPWNLDEAKERFKRVSEAMDEFRFSGKPMTSFWMGKQFKNKDRP